MKENALALKSAIENSSDSLQVQKILKKFAEDLGIHKYDLYDEDEDPFKIPPHNIHFIDKNMVITASTSPEFIGIPVVSVFHKEAGLADVVENKTSLSVEEMSHSGVRVISVSIPVIKNNKVIGALHYSEPYLKLKRAVNASLLRHAIFSLILTFSLTLFINLFLSKMVTNPIKKLSHGMDRIRMGGEGDQINITSKDEIGLVARSFNQMLLALKERSAEVKKYTTGLEDMVNERTKELKESNAQLIQTEKLASMGKLAGYVAHEINNPIGIIVSRAECIEMDLKEQEYPDNLLKDIEVIKKHSNRIALITKGMLTFSRKSPAEFSTLNINDIIDEALLLLEKQFSFHSIEIHKNYDCEIPQIHGNSNQLQQVFFNILSNAKDAMPDGGEINVRSHCNADGMIRIKISDNGTGIAKADLENIFEPFFTTKEAGRGTGLGLSVAYGIIKDHQGRIHVNSQPGAGTTFNIELPFKQTF